MSVHDSESSTTSFEVALARMRDACGALELQTDESNFPWSETVRGNGRFAIRRWVFESGAPVRATASPTDEVAIAWAAAGDLSWSVDGERGGGNAPFMFLPGHTMRLEGTGVDLRVVCMDRRAIERVARSTYNDAGLELSFSASSPVSDALGRHWTATLQTYEDLFRDPAVLRSSQIRAAAFQHLAVVTLETFRMTGDRDERTDAAAQLSTAFQDAKGFIDGHSSLPIDAGDVAQAADVSRVELGRAFESHSTGSATDLIEETRLESAHTDLQRSDPTLGDTVREVAERWGFDYPDGFARLYRKRFGESPKDTLDG